MKIAVCDDDSAAREHIISLINEQILNTEVINFASGEEIVNRQEYFDIYFLT